MNSESDKKNANEVDALDRSKDKKPETETNALQTKENHKEMSNGQNNDGDKGIGRASSPVESKDTEDFLYVNGGKILVSKKILYQREDVIATFHPGDTIRVHIQVKEGEKQRIQIYEGVVIRIRGEGLNVTFTVRRITHDIGVERIFFLCSPFIKKIDLKSHGSVRRANLSYLRKGNRMAKIKEKKKKKL